jgi:hypothetical protein
MNERVNRLLIGVFFILSATIAVDLIRAFMGLAQ